MNSLPKEVNAVINGKKISDVAIKLIYKNWRGEVAERTIIPLSIFLGKTEFHKEEQWLMRVYDLDKKDYRDYALKDVQDWKRVP